MKKILRTLGSRIFRYLPPDDEAWYSLCLAYVNRYRGENNDDMHTNGELNLLRQALVGRQIVFDIGANVGNWSATAHEIDPDIELHCFEPSAATFEKLKAKLLPENAHLNNFGLSSRSAERDLYIYEAGSGLNTLYQRQGLEDGWNLYPPEHTELIRLETLDWYCQTNDIETIDFLKVDVEGHELEVFKGGMMMLGNQRIKTIQFEYGGCNIDVGILLRDYFNFFQPLNYTLYKIYPGGLRRYPKYDQRIENFQYQNWAALCQGNNFKPGAVITEG